MPRVRALFAIVTLAVLFMGTPSPAATGLETLGVGVFTAIASAESVRTTTTSPSAPMSSSGDAGYHISQAQTSMTASTAFASSPFPGDAVNGNMGLVSATSGVPVTYPPYVASSHPSAPEVRYEEGGITLLASSSATSSRASASGPEDGDGSAPAVVGSSSAHTIRHAQTVEAVASATFDGFDVADVLTVGTVNTSARVVRAAGADPVRTTTFELSALTVAGSEAPIDEDGAIVMTALQQAALEQAGLALSYQEPRNRPDGVDSAALVVTHTFDDPASGRAHVRHLVGQSSATVYPVMAAAVPVPAAPATDAGTPGVKRPAVLGFGSSPEVASDEVAAEFTPLPAPTLASVDLRPVHWLGRSTLSALYAMVVATAAAAGATAVVASRRRGARS